MYACEAYGAILERATTPTARRALAEQVAVSGFGEWNKTVDATELANILRASCQARNGWQVILRRCSPAPPPPSAA